MKTIKKISSILFVASALITVSATLKANELHDAVNVANVEKVKDLVKTSPNLINKKANVSHTVKIISIIKLPTTEKILELNNVTPVELAAKLRMFYNKHVIYASLQIITAVMTPWHSRRRTEIANVRGLVNKYNEIYESLRHERKANLLHEAVNEGKIDKIELIKKQFGPANFNTLKNKKADIFHKVKTISFMTFQAGKNPELYFENLTPAELAAKLGDFYNKELKDAKSQAIRNKFEIEYIEAFANIYNKLKKELK